MVATLGPRFSLRGRLAGMLGAYDPPAFIILQCEDSLTRYQRALGVLYDTYHGMVLSCVYKRFTIYSLLTAFEIVKNYKLIVNVYGHRTILRCRFGLPSYSPARVRFR